MSKYSKYIEKNYQSLALSKMSCIIIPENLRSPNSTVLVHLCRVPKIKHTANRIFVVCFIEAHGKGDGRPNGVPGRHLCCVSYFRHTAKSVVCRVPYLCMGRLAWHTAYLFFAVCYIFAVWFFSCHTANPTFAMCPMFGPWQTFRHMANAGFPVVLAGSCGRTWLILCVCVLI